MTREEAIERFETLLLHVDTDCVMGMETTEAINMAVSALKAQMDGDTISRRAAIDALMEILDRPNHAEFLYTDEICRALGQLPSAQPVIRCKDCKHWRQQTNYAGAPLSFGFCESDEMWQSLYGEACEVSHIDTDDDFYCGYAERRTDERQT